MGEVLTWQDCKFHGHSDNGPGLVITWRADSTRWNVTAPSGRKLTKGVSVTQYRLNLLRGGSSVSGISFKLFVFFGPLVMTFRTP